MAAVLCIILAWILVNGISADSPVYFPLLQSVIEANPDHRAKSIHKWDSHGQTAFHSITGWWRGTYTINGGFCRNFSDGGGYLACCADVPISFNASVAIFATQKEGIPMIVVKLEGKFNIKQMNDLIIQVSSFFFVYPIHVGGYSVGMFLPLETHGPGTYKSEDGGLAIVLGQGGEDTLQLSRAVLPWRSYSMYKLNYSTIHVPALPLDPGNCTPGSHWHLPRDLSTEVDRASYAFKAALQMRRGRQTLDEAQATAAIFNGTPLNPQGTIAKGAAIPSEAELPVVLPSSSTTEGTSTFTTTPGNSTLTATTSLTAQSLVQEDNLNQSSASDSNANKDGSRSQFILVIWLSFVCEIWCCGCIWVFRCRICPRRHNQAAQQSANDFVNAARERVAHDGGNHSESIFANGEFDRLAKLGIDEHWLLPQQSLVLHKAPMSSSERQHVQGTLPGFIQCIATLMQLANNDNSTYMEFCNEVRLSRLARHPNIVRFLGLVQLNRDDTTYLAMVHEWIEGITLEAHVAQMDQFNQSTDEATELRFLLQVAEAMNYLHSLKPAIVHCDLRPHSVLIETVVAPPRAKLSNFAKALHGDRVAVFHGPPDGYVAPEVANAEPYSPASDVFSFGGICSFVLCGNHPSSSRCDMDILPQPYTKASSALGNVQKKCQLQRPAKRPRFSEVHKILDHGLQNI